MNRWLAVEQEVVSCVAAFIPWLPDMLLRLTLLAALVALALVLLPRRMPALRHMTATLGLFCLAVVNIRGLRLESAASLQGLWLLVWAAVSCLLLLRLLLDGVLISWGATRRTREAPAAFVSRLQGLRRRLGCRRSVALRLAAAETMPHTWGMQRPVIVLPSTARQWHDECLDAVLLHELAHIQRCDALWSTLQRAAFAFLWFHPLAWWLLRCAGEEAERACDARVLQQGMPPARYARHLLFLVRAQSRRRRLPAPAMAAGRGLEGRLHALLQRTPCRPFEDRIRAVPAVLVVMALLMPTGLLARHAAVMQPLARESGTLAACFGSEEAGLLNHESEVRASFERRIPREEPFSHPQP